MDTYYEKWLEREKEWISNANKQEMRRTKIYILLLIPALPLLSLVFGLSSGAPDFWKGMPGSLLIGIGMSAAIWIGVSLNNSAKRYEKYIQKELDGMSRSEQESFARQMLGEEPDTEMYEVTWKGMTEGQNLVRITRDYLTFSCDRGSFQIIPLWKTERIELDVEDGSYRAGSGGTSVRIAYESYPLKFYYKGNQKGECDTSYIFGKRRWRDEVVQAIQAVSEDKRFFQG